MWEPSTRIPLIIAGVPGTPTGESCDHPVSLIDIYPTFNDLCGLNKNPNQQGNGYELEGHSLCPLLLNPSKGEWTGPDVAITTIPGKNHMQHQVYEGSLYPHFSVRSKRYRYSLTSNGGEELYDHQTDPLEWKNLAQDPDHHVIKESLKAQLIELRDGNRWRSLQSLDSWQLPPESNLVQERGGLIRLSGKKGFEMATAEKFEHFELEFDAKARDGNVFSISYRGAAGHRISMPVSDSPEAEHSKFQAGQWNRYRIRVHNKRHQLWINNRFVSDFLNKEDITDKMRAERICIHYAAGLGSLDIRNTRIRKL